jgi:uncharacterized protein YdaU (DUF1376 family)
MARLPFMPFYAKDFLGDPRVMALTMEQRGVYALLLVHMWNNDGYLPADYKAVARIVGADPRTVRVYLEALQPLFERETDAFVGPVLTQKRLQRERELAIEHIEKLKEKTANARAAKARKRAREALSQDDNQWPVTKPQEPPADVSHSVSDSAYDNPISHISKRQSASPSRAERSVAADLAGLGVRHLEDEIAQPDEPVTEPQIAPMVELPAPSPSLLNSKLGNGAKPVPASDGDKPRRGLMAALDRAAQKRNGAEDQ